MDITKNLTKERYREIEKRIASSESVVGIDAKETHIIIIQKLLELEDQISELKEKVDSIKG